MNKVLLFLTILLTFHPALGQKVILSENFDYASASSILGWTNTPPWEAGTPYLVAGSVHGPCAYNAGNNKIVGVADSDIIYGRYTRIDNALLYSPVINLLGIPHAWVGYDSYFLKYAPPGYVEDATVEVSADTGKTWSILQHQPADTAGIFATYYLDLSQFDGKHVNIGFRYKDGGRGNMKGWGLDNIKVFIPARKDMAMDNLNGDTLLNYAVVGQPFYHHARARNYGLDTVRSFVVKYQQDGGPVKAQTITGVVLPSFHTYDFTFAAPDTVYSVGPHNISMWVEIAGDTIHSNDTASIILNGADFMPKKLLFVEEGTSTRDYWGPRGWVYMNQLATGADLQTCEVSIHADDPMEVPEYNQLMYECNYYPCYFVVDRRQNIGYDTFFATVNKWKTHFGFADIKLDGGLNGTSLNVNVHVRPAVDLDGDYRLALIITEDSVTGVTHDYDQYDGFSYLTLGPMGGFENLPNPVPAADMHYNFVARAILPSPQGDPGMLPKKMIHSTVYDYSFYTLVNRSWNVNKLRAEVILLNKGDSTVLNSNKLLLYLQVNSPPTQQEDVGIFPNPASNMATVYFTPPYGEPIHLLVYDLSGRVQFDAGEVKVYPGRNSIKIPVNYLLPGVYIVDIESSSFKKSLKLEVNR